jgi:hypothetical protein
MENNLSNIHIDFIKEKMQQALSLLELIDREINVVQLSNEQFVLDFYDKINEISVRK